ncbi:SAV_2336 N-terminal domain-related protein [Streptomyces sp. NPDC006372]|uniref:SAV_2336 N-terminal domain-related protein n=1 Tax=Streptomyces sp. NPDC006372 TaxID=3155599 RepID=UPI0033B7EFC1
MTTEPGTALTELVERLRAVGAQPSPRELAEALWLARHVTPADTPERRPAPPPGRTEHPGPSRPAPGRPHTTPPAAAGTGRPPRDPERSRLYPRTGRGMGTAADPGFVAVRVPAATALPHALTLQRALRPLQHYCPPLWTGARLLDEQATAERAAETGLLLPVLHTTARREARLQLLMDASSSTTLWDRAFEELRLVCAGLGAFHEVTAHYVHEGANGRLLVGPDRTGGKLRPAEQLRDPTGRQLTLLLSDAAGPLWRDGRLQRLLHHWGQAAPVALVQPLPQRMWAGTHLPALPGMLRRREGLGAHLEFTPAHGPVPRGALPVPVLAPTRAGLGTWARLLSGTTGLSLPAAAAWALPGQTSSGAGAGPAGASPTALVRSFRHTASPEAQKLALALAAVPLVLPVMQLVQRALLPHTGPQTLAEVVLSGLLRRGDQEGWYDFLPGVRDVLLRSLPMGDALLVLKHCGEYVERHFGRRASNFPARALARLTGGTGPAGTDAVAPELQPFAEVSDLVTSRYAAAAPPRRKFAVLYSGRDREWAEWAESVLEPTGHLVEVENWDPDGAGSATALDIALRDHVRGGATVVVVLGEGGGDQPWWALGRWAARHPDRIVPLLAAMRGTPQAIEPLKPIRLSGAYRRTLARLLLAQLSLADPLPEPAVWEGVPDPAPLPRERDDLLHALREKLTAAGENDAACLIFGEPGVGKTQLAAAYAHVHRFDYDLVWWVDARFPEGLRARLAELARGAGEQEASAHWSRLVVLDGWDEPEAADDVLNSLPDAHVVITSGDDRWRRRLGLGVIWVSPWWRTSEASGDAAALTRRGTVRIERDDGGGPRPFGAGFFVAPGRVVTCAHVVTPSGAARPGVSIVTWDGRRFDAERADALNNPGDGLAVLKVPDATDAECLWISDLPPHTHDEVVMLNSALGGVEEGHFIRAVMTDRHRERPNEWLLGLSGQVLSAGSSGSPVVDLREGAVVGVVSGVVRRPDGDTDGVALEISALHDVRPGGIADEIIRAHDGYHLAWHHDPSREASSWIDVHTRSMRGAGQERLPLLRAELYALLAELGPLFRPEDKAALAGTHRLEPFTPRMLREGAGAAVLNAEREAGLLPLLEYAAHVWRLGHERRSREPAVDRLRDWIHTTAGTDLDAVTRRRTAALLREPRPEPDIPQVRVVVEVYPAPWQTGSYQWRVARRLDNGDFMPLAEDTSSVPRGRLWETIRPYVLSAVRVGGVPTVQFSLPPGLLDEPVDRWPVGPGPRDGLLGDHSHVVVRVPEGRGNSLPLRDWRTRWAGVTGRRLFPVPLVPLLSGPSADWGTLRTMLEQAPSTAVPVYCRHPESAPGLRAMGAALAAGYPVVLWSRGADHSDCGEFYERASDLVREAGTLRHLFDRVRDLRLRTADPDAVGSDTVWARNLALVYDPPDVHPLPHVLDAP